jgi:inosine-uridine nucleoside N-ribohydrolase
MTFFADSYKRVFNFADPPLHDPCAIAYVIAPELFTTKWGAAHAGTQALRDARVHRLTRIDIETHTELCLGQTVCDDFDYAQRRKPKNAVVGAGRSRPSPSLSFSLTHAMSCCAQRSP